MQDLGLAAVMTIRAKLETVTAPPPHSAQARPLVARTTATGSAAAGMLMMIAVWLVERTNSRCWQFWIYHFQIALS